MFEFPSRHHAAETKPQPRGAGVSFVAKAEVPTEFGAFTIHGFLEHETGKEHLALVAGSWSATDRVDVRIHSECLTGDVLASLRCDCRPQLHAALRSIGADGGIVLYLRQEGRDIGLLNKLRAYALQERGLDTVDANRVLGFPDDLRSYDSAAAMLRHLGVSKIRLLTNNPQKVAEMLRAGIDVVRQSHEQAGNPHNLRYLMTKAERCGHLLQLTPNVS